MILICIIIFYVIYGHRMSYTFDAFKFDSGEDFPPFPFAGLLLLCGSSFGPSDFVLHCMCRRSHNPCFGLFPVC